MLHAALRRLLPVLLLAAPSPAAGGEAADSHVPRSLTDEEWRQYLEMPPYVQPSFQRMDYSTPGSNAHILLQRAAELHQDGDYEKTVQILKGLLQKADQMYHGEAYAALAKVLNDQGKFELADRAMGKSNRLYNDGLAQWSLF